MGWGSFFGASRFDSVREGSISLDGKLKILALSGVIWRYKAIHISDFRLPISDCLRPQLAAATCRLLNCCPEMARGVGLGGAFTREPVRTRINIGVF
jgi:hypothetical protein